ncbi:hypothetical protein LCGC14_1412170 [marine sediment metagenome]|uniref:Uncharacterized protein n=1 Tax=marine sediment metagenome TaxID=412755 RepID=A0A0F9MVP1_9ZZZZ
MDSKLLALIEEYDEVEDKDLLVSEIDKLYNEPQPDWQKEQSTKTVSRYNEPDQDEIERDKISKSNAIGMGLIPPDRSRLLTVGESVKAYNAGYAKDVVANLLTEEMSKREANGKRAILEAQQSIDIEHRNWAIADMRKQSQARVDLLEAEHSARIEAFIKNDVNDRLTFFDNEPHSKDGRPVVDEVVLSNATVHLECLSDQHFMLIVENDKHRWHLTICAGSSRSKIYAVVQETEDKANPTSEVKG